MEKTTHYEETTKVVENAPGHAIHDTAVDTKHKTKNKKHKKDKHHDQYGPKKTVGTKIKEFFTGRRDDGIVYQNGLPIAGLNGPIVQPMGAPIRQPAEIHPVATMNAMPANTGHIPGEHHHGPTTTTYGPAPPLAPGMPEGYTKTTTHTEVVHPGMEAMQPMNAIAQPTGLGAIVQPAGVIIAKRDKATMGLKDGYLKDQKIHDFPHDKIRDKPLHAEKHKDRHHAHEEIRTQTTTEEFAAPPVMPVGTVPAEPAPVIFTGPARVLDEKHHAAKDIEKQNKKLEKEHLKEEKRAAKHDKHGQNLYEQPYHTNVDTVIARPNSYLQPTVLEQQPMPVTVIGPGPTPAIAQEHYHEPHHLPAQTNMVPNTAVVNQQPGFILQQPGMAPSTQPIVRNHEQVPMNSQSGLAQGGMFQNETARPVQTFTPIVQQNQPLTQPPILDQAIREQEAFAPAGIRTKEGLVETRAPHASTSTKHNAPAAYEERKETVVHKDVKY